jgi:uncharacterized protein YgbK (DUF1537 family)
VRGQAQQLLDAFRSLAAEGRRLAIVDAIEDADLRAIGAACRNLPLVTGGSGIAIGLPENFRRQDLLGPAATADALPHIEGASAVLSGSCSRATQEQVRIAAAKMPAFRLDPLVLAEEGDTAAQVLAWATPRLAAGPVLVYATADPESVRATQTRLGAERAGALVEQVLSTVARDLVAAGVRRLVVAGGETSGAVVKELGVEGLRIGREIDPGVPWTVTLGDPPLALALKSGNFGGPDFFLKAFARSP